MRFLDAAATRAALPIDDAIAAMEAAFHDDRETPQRILLGSSLFMPGRVAGYSGIKVVSTVPGNPVGLVIAFDGDGNPLGIIDGSTLTAIRTGAGAGLATRLLAAEDATAMAMLGAGAMAADQIAAVKAVRDIDRVLIWSRSSERAAELASLVVGGEVVDSANEAVAVANIITTATPSRRPLFDHDALDGVVHINAVGAFTPEMAEIPPETVREAYVVVDDVDAAAAEAGDLLQAGVEPDATVGDLLAGRAEPGDQNVTLFKSVGISSQDVAAAVAALERAEAEGLGVEL